MQWLWVAAGLSLLVASGCGKNGEVPESIAGAWELQFQTDGCDLIPAILGGDVRVSVQVFDMQQNGPGISAQFVDVAGNQFTVTGTYQPDQFRGEITVEEEATGRVLRLRAQGFARVRGADVLVSGWARIEFDSAQMCAGEVVEFRAEVDPGTGGQEGGDPPGTGLADCPPVDLVVVMDTSESMEDEAEALCDAVASLEQTLLDRGLPQARVTLLGIVQTPSIVETGAKDPDPPPAEFGCLTGTVYRMAGGTGRNHPRMPGAPWPTVTYEREAGDIETITASRLDPGDSESEAFWGSATAIVAKEFAWLPEPGVVRLVVPIADGSPQTGRGRCWTVDQACIENTARVAWSNGVRVSPLLGTPDDEEDPCIEELARTLATRTGGMLATTTSAVTAGAADPILELLVEIVRAACAGRNDELPEPPGPGAPPTRPELFGEETLVAFNRNGEPHTIDRDTGVATPMFQLANDIGFIASSIFLPDRGEFWFGTGGGGAVCAGCIFHLDMFAREATLLADNQELNAHPGLALDGNGVLFGVARPVLGMDRFLYRISTATATVGQATLIGGWNGGFSGNGMVFVGDTVYVAQDDEMYAVDPTDASGVSLGAFTFVGFTQGELDKFKKPTVNSMTMSKTGVVYGLAQEGSGTSRAHLVTIEFAPGPILTKVGPIVNELRDWFPANGLSLVPTNFLEESLLPPVSLALDLGG